MSDQNSIHVMVKILMSNFLNTHKNLLSQPTTLSIGMKVYQKQMIILLSLKPLEIHFTPVVLYQNLSNTTLKS